MNEVANIKKSLRKIHGVGVSKLLKFTDAYPIHDIENEKWLESSTTIQTANNDRISQRDIFNSICKVYLEFRYKGKKYIFPIYFKYENSNIQFLSLLPMAISNPKSDCNDNIELLFDFDKMQREIKNMINQNKKYDFIYMNTKKQKADDIITKQISKESKVNKLFIHVGKGKIKWIDSYKNIIAEGIVDKDRIISDIKLSNGKYIHLDKTYKLIKYDIV